MANPTQRRQERLEKIYQSLMSGASYREVMQVFGLEESTFYEALDYLRKNRADFAPPKAGTSPAPPIVTEISYKLRARLGDLLWDLRDNANQKRDRTTIAELTGIPSRKQLKAEARPYDHDWTISQIERLASARNESFSDVMKKVTA